MEGSAKGAQLVGGWGLAAVVLTRPVPVLAEATLVAAGAMGLSPPAVVAAAGRARPRHRHPQRVGALLTCPFFLALWVATAFGFGLVLAPRVTRFALSVLAAVAGADVLHFAYAMGQDGFVIALADGSRLGLTRPVPPARPPTCLSLNPLELSTRRDGHDGEARARADVFLRRAERRPPRSQSPPTSGAAGNRLSWWVRR